MDMRPDHRPGRIAPQKAARSVGWLAALFLLFNPGHSLTGRSPVPPEFKQMFIQLNACLTSLHGDIDQAWNHKLYAGLVPMASVLPANSNAGPVLLNPQSMTTTRLFITRLWELGCRGLQLDIQFPVLDPNFFSFAKSRGLMPADDPEAADYLQFYKTVVRDIRALGMKVSVETQVVFTDPTWSPLPVEAYYAFFDADGEAGLARYIQCKRAMVQTIAAELAPDYLTVCDEPETEMALTGIGLLRNADNYLSMVMSLSTAARQAGPAGMKLGNGFLASSDSWSFWVDRLLRLDNDFLNVHVYALDLAPALPSKAIYRRVLDAADRARAAGRPLALGEAWLYKTLGVDFRDTVEIFGRDFFDFWQPLDEKFLSLMLKVAHFKRFEFVSPFWSTFFFSYLTYDEAKSLTTAQRKQLNNQRVLQNLVQGFYSDTGQKYGRMITEGPDLFLDKKGGSLD